MKEDISRTKTDNVLLIVAVITVVISIVGAGITYNHLASFRNRLTGFATEGGWINLTIQSNVAINFTTNMVNWSNGSVTDGQTNAELDTSNKSANNVSRGTWLGNTRGLVVENIGNKNVTLEIKSSADNGTFIGGTAGGGPLFRWKIYSNDTNTACNFTDLGKLNNTWWDVNTTGNGGKFCNQFYFEDNRDQVGIDFFVRIPSDSITGDRGLTITATFSAS